MTGVSDKIGILNVLDSGKMSGVRRTLKKPFERKTLLDAVAAEVTDQLACPHAIPFTCVDIITRTRQTSFLHACILLTMIFLNLLLGTFVVAVGFWLLWSAAFPALVAGWTLAVGGLLWWKGRTITEVWAWSTLLLGLESFAWPLISMIQMKGATETASEGEMGTILSTVILGLFSSVFWISFSYGLFKRAWGGATDAPRESLGPPLPPQPRERKKAR